VTSGKTPNGSTGAPTVLHHDLALCYYFMPLKLKMSAKNIAFCHFESPENNQSNEITTLKELLENDFHSRHGRNVGYRFMHKNMFFQRISLVIS
jgi:hypothetical protein